MINQFPQNMKYEINVRFYITFAPNSNFGIDILRKSNYVTNECGQKNHTHIKYNVHVLQNLYIQQCHRDLHSPKFPL